MKNQNGLETAGTSIKDYANKQIPEHCRTVFFKAHSGKSRASGIKAFCHMCMGWEDVVKSIKDCGANKCPLYKYRPYKKPASQ